jgi:tetratricopeptide (TPR) repeat protein
MKKLMQIITTVLMVGMAAIWSTPMNAQCKTWNGDPQMEAATDAHTVYRGMVDSKEDKGYDNPEAFKQWKMAYDIAPAADGKRSFHYSDGRKFYMHKFKTETDEAKKKEYVDMILKLYDEHVECYPDESATVLGLKVYDMFYNFRSPYAKLKEVMDFAIETNGNKTSYVLFQPYASLVVYNFTNDLMDKETARDIHQKLNEIAEHNIANDETYGSYYKQAQEAMNGTFAPIENNIFDCDYFKKKLEPEYRANPDDWDLIKNIYNRLTAQGCDPADPLVAELKTKYDVLVAEENERRLQELYKEDPGLHANALYKDGDYTTAAEKYMEAIEMQKAKGDAADNDKLGDYYFALAVIKFRKQKVYSQAREYARKAAQYKPNWGQPYMLIGDMYASTSNSCGKESWDKQMAVLAAIDKYAYARSIDSEVSEEASKKIGRYAEHRPEKEEGFMRKVSEGTKVRVGCWIGETVSVRFK